jgi:K+-transporting ATPase A subunit
MTKNMGTADRAVRTLLALGVAALYFTGRISGTLAIVLGVVAVVFLATSFIGWCPAYLPFEWSTTRKE